MSVAHGHQQEKCRLSARAARKRTSAAVCMAAQRGTAGNASISWTRQRRSGPAAGYVVEDKLCTVSNIGTKQNAATAA